MPLALLPLLLALLALPRGAYPLDNGLALIPPRGFRTWNQFGIDVNQTMMSDVFRAMAAKRPAQKLDDDPLDRAMSYREVGLERRPLAELGFSEAHRGQLGLSSTHVHEVAFSCSFPESNFTDTNRWTSCAFRSMV